MERKRLKTLAVSSIIAVSFISVYILKRTTPEPDDAQPYVVSDDESTIHLGKVQQDDESVQRNSQGILKPSVTCDASLSHLFALATCIPGYLSCHLVFSSITYFFLSKKIPKAR